MIRLSRVYAISKRHLLTLRHRPLRIVSLAYQSGLALFMWGIISAHLETLTSRAAGAGGILLGAIILWQFLTHIQLTVTMPFREDMRTRNLVNIFSSPLTLPEYCLGLIGASMATAVLVLILLVVGAYALFWYYAWGFGVLFVPYAGVVLLFGLGLGMFTVGLLFRIGISAEALTWSLPALIAPFSGVFYPVSALPQIMQPVSYLLPTTYIFEGMRTVTNSGIIDVGDLSLALALSLLYLAAAFWFLARAYKKALRQGLLKKFLTD